MLKSNPILLPIAVLFIASLACAAPSVTIVTTPDPNAINTMVVQTVVAAASQTAQALMPVTSPEIPTLAPALPTLSPTATVSPIPVFTSTPTTPLITVSVATNCRVGPGRVYDRVGALFVGEVAEVFGVDPTGRYWYIRNPDQTNGFCWLWGEYATLTGNLTALPIYTPPPSPTPTPNFTVEYDGLDTCVGWWVDFRLENTGGVTFRSISITLRDRDTSTVVALSANGFTNNNGCTESNTRDTLEPENRRVMSSPAFTYDPTGHNLRATITLCSNRDQSGMCVSEVIEFKP